MNAPKTQNGGNTKSGNAVSICGDEERRGEDARNPNLNRNIASVAGSGAMRVYAGSGMPASSAYGGGTSARLWRREASCRLSAEGVASKVYPKTASVGSIALKEVTSVRVSAGAGRWASRSKCADVEVGADIVCEGGRELGY